jgi:ATP-binding cassette, subfamily D (ALD), member 3
MAHQRLIVNSEEIAFYDGSARELSIIEQLFMQLFRHHRFTLWRKLIVGIFDTYLVKYGASIVGYVILCFPVFSGAADPNKTAADLARDYVRNRVLLINLAQAIGYVIDWIPVCLSLSLSLSLTVHRFGCAMPCHAMH